MKQKIVRTISIDAEIWELAMANSKNLSALVEGLLKDWLEVKKDKKDSIKSIQLRMERLEAEKYRLERELAEVKKTPKRTKVGEWHPSEL